MYTYYIIYICVCVRACVHIITMRYEICRCPLIPFLARFTHFRGSPEVGIGPTADQFTHLLASERQRWKIHHLDTSNTMPIWIGIWYGIYIYITLSKEHINLIHGSLSSSFFCFLMHLFICIYLYYLPSLYQFCYVFPMITCYWWYGGSLNGATPIAEWFVSVYFMENPWKIYHHLSSINKWFLSP